MKKFWPYIKYALELIFKISSFYKFKLLIISGIGIFFYSYQIVGKANKTNGTVSLNVVNQNNFSSVEVLIIFCFVTICIVFDYIQNRNSQKIFGDIVKNKDLEVNFRKEAMNKLKDIQ